IEPNLEFLTNLPGVGRKTANVVLSEGFKIPRIAVDTHVFRVSRRLGLSNSNNVLKVEEDLMNLIDEKMWGKAHLRLLRFGRYFCKSVKPNCSECPFQDICVYDNKNI
ncbi:MAG: endonuclease III, partial [Bacilli bacterium]|nr:endonuclease III [Bacilli bacterium]